MNLGEWKCVLVCLWGALDERCLFVVGRVGAGFILTHQDGIFTRLCQSHEFVRVFAADRAAVGLGHDDIETAAFVYPLVGLRHPAIADVETFLVRVEAVPVFHVEFAHSEESCAGALFISELRLYLIEATGEVSVAMHVRLDDVCDDFFVRRRDDEAASASISNAKHILSHHLGSSRLLPQFHRLKRGHPKFLCARIVHLFADDPLDLLE